MPAEVAPQLYLVTPTQLVPERFGPALAGLLDRFEIACVRLALASRAEDEIARAADALRETCHARDVPLVIAEHDRLVTRLGLDGVHLSDGSRRVRAVRQALGRDLIVGAHARASRHDGMTAAEIGADYVGFGPVSPSPLGDDAVADVALFQWWSEMIEAPVVAEGGLTPELAEALAPHADFLALGDELWHHVDGPEIALTGYLERLGR
jgi:thiamine-phosphate pyrophosphorylase